MEEEQRTSSRYNNGIEEEQRTSPCYTHAARHTSLIMKYFILMCLCRYIHASSILDDFTETPTSHCLYGGYRDANLPSKEVCAQLCLVRKDCSHFHWDAANLGGINCWLSDSCALYYHATSVTYTLNNHHLPELFSSAAIPGMHQFIHRDCQSNDYEYSIPLDEEECTILVWCRTTV